MNKSLRKIAGLAVVGAVILGGLATAQAANADPIGSGTITLYGVSTASGTVRGAPITSGNAADTRMFYGISVDATCPAGYKSGSQTAAFQGGVFKGALSTARDGSVTAYGATGLTPANVAMSDVDNAGAASPYVNNKRLNQLTSALTTGAWELRYYCSAGIPADLDFTTDKWFTLALTFNAATGAWAVATPAENTTVSFTAGATGSDVTLTGTVKNTANATATAAVGSIQFFELPNTTTPVATAPVVSGVAATTLLSQPTGYHQYQAKFVSTDTAYNTSALSGTASVSIAGANSAPSTITVTVPNNVGALILSGVPASVNLGTAALNGLPGVGTLDASGTLAGVTVTDTRQLDFPGWSLTGQVSNFSDGTHTLLGKYLGWVPSKTSGPASSVAGASILAAPGTTDGISTAPKSFATGAPDAAGTVSVFSAQLNLKAPANTPAGTYSATLTITLA